MGVNTGVATANYTYLGHLRIKKTNGDGTIIYIYSGIKPIAEYAPGAVATNPSKEYIYAGSQRLASLAGTSTTYYHSDHLSNRAETDSSGNVVRSMGSFPFAESWYDSPTAEKWKFTTYERDFGAGETGLDYAQFRYYSSKQGRFMTADLLAGDSTMPQSMNRYSYVLSDPINLFDPAGLCGVVTVTETENDLNGHPKSKHTTLIDEGSCLGGGGGVVGGGGGLPGPPRQGGGGGKDQKPRQKTEACIRAEELLRILKEQDEDSPKEFMKEAAFGIGSELLIGCGVGAAATVETGPGALAGCGVGAAAAFFHGTGPVLLGSLAHLLWTISWLDHDIHKAQAEVAKQCN